MTPVAPEISDYERWLSARAATMIGPDTIHRGTAMDRADLVQVGRVAMWRAIETFDAERGAAPSWLTTRAYGSMCDALRARDKHRVYAAWFALNEHDQSCEQDIEDAVVWAYHRGEIAQALAALTPRQREYVQLRFWNGRSTEELTRHFGYDPRGVWAGARAKLAVSLQHLRGLS